MNVVLKGPDDSRVLIPVVREALQAMDPQKPAHGFHLLEELVGATYARDRQAMVTLLAFAGTTAFLAVLGVYGVLSQRVRERAREIGIRMAMGAGRVRVMCWVGSVGVRLMTIGAAAGALAAWALAGALEGLLFGVAAGDAATAVAVLAVLAAVGLVATLIPAWRATRVNPVEILRGG